MQELKDTFVCTSLCECVCGVSVCCCCQGVVIHYCGCNEACKSFVRV